MSAKAVTRSKRSNKPRTMIAVLREIRKKLTGKVRKVGQYTYYIDEKVEVELNYYCNRTTKPMTCEPHTISIRMCNDYRSDYTSPHSGVFTTRTIQKRVDGSYNYESMLTAITKCFSAIETWEERLATKRKSIAKIKKIREDTVKALSRILPKRGRTDGRNGFTHKEQKLRIAVSVDNDYKAKCRFDCDDVDVSAIKEMIKLALKK